MSESTQKSNLFLKKNNDEVKPFFPHYKKNEIKTRGRSIIHSNHPVIQSDARRNNKFDVKSFQIKNNRKVSRDSTTESESEENKNSEGPKYNNFQLVSDSKGIFKAHAYDFKIKYKTELCKYFEMNGYCPYGENCAYAHGIENLRIKTTNSSHYRTKKCSSFFSNGYCPYGSRCQFSHSEFENKNRDPISYIDTLEILNKKEDKEVCPYIKIQRLPIFEEMSKNKNDKLYRLEEDSKNTEILDIYIRKNEESN